MMSYRNRKVRELCKLGPFDQRLGRELAEIQPFEAAHANQDTSSRGKQAAGPYFVATLESPKDSGIDATL